MGPKIIKLIRLEYFPTMILSRMARNNSLRIFPVGHACGDDGTNGSPCAPAKARR